MTTSRVPFTVRVEQDLNIELKRWLADAAGELGVSRVTAQELTVALYAELLDNTRLHRAIVARLSNP